MKIEHVALQVSNPAHMCDWYCEHLGMQIKRSVEGPPVTCFFLADDSDQVMLEIYYNPKAVVPEYRSMNPLLLHVAFVSDDVAADKARLIEAGAKEVEHQQLDNGDEVAMLRDPWGLAIQLCRRAKPML